MRGLRQLLDELPDIAERPQEPAVRGARSVRKALGPSSPALVKLLPHHRLTVLWIGCIELGGILARMPNRDAIPLDGLPVGPALGWDDVIRFVGVVIVEV
jgi:hypothetical protein